MNKARAKSKLVATVTASGVSAPILELIQEVADTFVQGVANNMQKAGMVYKNNIEIVIQENLVSIVLPMYMEYIDKGVNGTEINYGSPYNRGDKLPPLDEVRSFMQERGIPIENGSEYAMQLSWNRNGIKPTDIYGSLLLQLSNEIRVYLVDNLSQILIQDINEEISGEVNIIKQKK